jgi:hypothetical protein
VGLGLEVRNSRRPVVNNPDREEVCAAGRHVGRHLHRLTGRCGPRFIRGRDIGRERNRSRRSSRFTRRGRLRRCRACVRFDRHREVADQLRISHKVGRARRAADRARSPLLREAELRSGVALVLLVCLPLRRSHGGDKIRSIDVARAITGIPGRVWRRSYRNC